MPLYRPSILLSDAYGSAGSVTFYHRNGRCYTRKRVKVSNPGTPAQLEHLAIHRRAMAAWASLDRDTQLKWIEYETTAEPHRPPFDHKAHISGNNLFISAYHGFALMGNEHTPEPNPFENLPPFAMVFQSAMVVENDLHILARATIGEHDYPERYCIYVRLSISAPGTGYSLRGMRGFLAEGNGSGFVTITVSSYQNFWDVELPEYQLHSQCILLDRETGFRSQYQRHSAIIPVTYSSR